MAAYTRLPAFGFIYIYIHILLYFVLVCLYKTSMTFEFCSARSKSRIGQSVAVSAVSYLITPDYGGVFENAARIQV